MDTSCKPKFYGLVFIENNSAWAQQFVQIIRAPSEDSDNLEYLHIPIRVFTSNMKNNYGRSKAIHQAHGEDSDFSKITPKLAEGLNLFLTTNT